MRRADRLFQIVQILRNKRVVTARQLAERLQISERTVYRDLRDLSLSGLPISGEAGVGYRLSYSLDIPPLMFSATELEALAIGAKMVQSWGGAELGMAAQSVLDKITAVVPPPLKSRIEYSKLHALRLDAREDLDRHLDVCRQGIDQQRLLALDYRRADGACSQRLVRPLGLYFWGALWTLVAWCQLRNEFRQFRLDRMTIVTLTEQTFQEQADCSLQAFLAQIGQCDR